MSAKLTCCGMDAIWVNNGPRLQYWYCGECKSEVLEKKEEQLSFNFDGVPNYPSKNWSIPNPAQHTAISPRPHIFTLTSGAMGFHCSVCSVPISSYSAVGGCPGKPAAINVQPGIQQQLANTPTQMAPGAHDWASNTIQNTYAGGFPYMCKKCNCSETSRAAHVSCPK